MAEPDDRGLKGPTSQESVRTWIDNTGQYTTKATLVDVNEGSVRLRKEDGSVVTVRIDKLSQADQEFLRDEATEGGTDAEGPGYPVTKPDYRPKRLMSEPRPGNTPEIISYVKPEMELYVAAENYTPPARTPGKIARMKCTCNLVCTCESVSACGCNLVKVRNPIDVGLVCVCDTVPVCTCNTVTLCSCDKVRTRVCDCDLVSVCRCEAVARPTPVCRCEEVVARAPRQRCICLAVCSCVGFFVCSCQRVGSGGGGSRSVCNCVPVIH